MAAEVAEFTGSERHDCPACGGRTEWQPQREGLVCLYCGTEIPFERRPQGSVEELDLGRALRELPEESRGWLVERRGVRCGSCNAISVFEPARVGQRCDFCGSASLVDYAEIEAPLRPEGLLPFRIDGSSAQRLLRAWFDARWLAPARLKRRAVIDSVRGVYLPYWTFDAAVTCDWTAESGSYYYTTESRRDAQGRVSTHRVHHVRWTPSAGRLEHRFDDETVAGSRGIEPALLRGVEPFPTTQVVPYDTAYLAGFVIEHYQVRLVEAAEHVRESMDQRLHALCAAQVPGDTHRHLQIQPVYTGRTFKHVLVPVWLLAYQYGGRAWQVVINGVTGQTAGRYPRSPWKIMAIVIAAGIAAALAAWFASVT